VIPRRGVLYTSAKYRRNIYASKADDAGLKITADGGEAFSLAPSKDCNAFSSE
jgi:hypothetical protein